MRKQFATHILYLVVGIASLVTAVFVSTKFVRSARSQDSSQPPSQGAVAESAALPADPNVVPPQAVTESAAQTPIADPAAATPTALAAPVPEGVTFLEPYIFDTREGRRNPFKPPLLEDGTLPDVVLPGTPLERYDLGELKLVGIMWDVSMPKAMVIDPQGEVHILGKEDRIGRKRGYIAVIRESEVVVVESSDFNGESTYATRILRIDR